MVSVSGKCYFFFEADYNLHAIEVICQTVEVNKTPARMSLLEANRRAAEVRIASHSFYMGLAAGCAKLCAV